MVEDTDTAFVISNRYTVRLAETEEELQQAQYLRYLVFNVELDEGLEGSDDYQLDIDKYDAQCDHLLVIDHKEEKVIGTYRMQTYRQAERYCGFYTSDEFDLSPLPMDILNQAVEVGRACIHQEHRNGRVLYLLWRGIAKYMLLKSARYLLGCCSLSSTNPRTGWETMEYLSQHGYLHSDLKIESTATYHCPPVKTNPEAWKEVELPELFQLYLNLKARVLSEPALDRSFKTIDFLILVDIEELDPQTKTLFFK